MADNFSSCVSRPLLGSTLQPLGCALPLVFKDHSCCLCSSTCGRTIMPDCFVCFGNQSDRGARVESYVFVVKCCAGQVIHHRPEKSQGQMDFGTMGVGESRSMIFTIRNDNPVDVSTVARLLPA